MTYHHFTSDKKSLCVFFAIKSSRPLCFVFLKLYFLNLTKLLVFVFFEFKIMPSDLSYVEQGWELYKQVEYLDQDKTALLICIYVILIFLD